jgi:hypothetical protein
MNFFKRYLFKKALLEDELANEERRRKETQMVINKQPEAIVEEKPVTPPSPVKAETTATAAVQKPQPRKNEMTGELGDESSHKQFSTILICF